MKPRVLLWATVTAYAAGFGSLSILRHRAFNTGRYDLGNMVQTVWNTAHGHFLQMTSGAAGLDVKAMPVEQGYFTFRSGIVAAERLLEIGRASCRERV